MRDIYCPAGKIECLHSYINDSSDKCCNPNHTELPVGVWVVVSPTEGFPANEVCRWPSKIIQPQEEGRKGLPEIVGKSVLPAEDTLKEVTEDQISEVLKNIAIEKIAEQRVLEVFLYAFRVTEGADVIVSDTVMDALSFSMLRKYCRDVLDVCTHSREVHKGLLGVLYGSNMWVCKEAVGITCFCEGSKELGKQFPAIASAKEELKR